MLMLNIRELAAADNVWYRPPGFISTSEWSYRHQLNAGEWGLAITLMLSRGCISPDEENRQKEDQNWHKREDSDSHTTAYTASMFLDDVDRNKKQTVDRNTDE